MTSEGIASNLVPDFGRYGIFCPLHAQDTREQADVAAEIEGMGYGTLWVGNSTIDNAMPLLGATQHMVIGTAIQSIWRLPAQETAFRLDALESVYPGRFQLGLGVSHPQAAADYRRPYSAMVEYLDILDGCPTSVPPLRRTLAALGPRMLRLARDRSAGAMPYLVTTEQVAHAREALGDGPVLSPELGVVLESDPERARTLAREAVSFYLGLTNYRKSWLRGGFTEDDMSNGGSDRLIDALFAWGSEQDISARIHAFFDAGADHLALQVFDGSGPGHLPRRGWERVSEMLSLG
ncbi:LLM class F420-dependent oxidoreductase [Streptomyces xiaopingdaonensis]|uniref:LLM class F420-dependent oxidoreductase n=1 Tax=Streptomyces xiaopingdaonensis TaxID=1565415 RepID=UPI0002FDCFB5|nr:LLM class F420-dependent oxidoreductase [Streptomyces xiaopingdaonensis]